MLAQVLPGFESSGERGGGVGRKWGLVTWGQESVNLPPKVLIPPRFDGLFRSLQLLSRRFGGGGYGTRYPHRRFSRRCGSARDSTAVPLRRGGTP